MPRPPPSQVHTWFICSFMNASSEPGSHHGFTIDNPAASRWEIASWQETLSASTEAGWMRLRVLWRRSVKHHHRQPTCLSVWKTGYRHATNADEELASDGHQR